jgi:hypothetical protein
MLKSLNKPQLSPASPSPRLQQQSRYASSSPRTTTSTSRRKSNISDTSPTPAPAPSRPAVQYVSRGTQYSPMLSKMDDIRPDQTMPTTQLPQRSELPKPTELARAIPPSPTKPVIQPESPGTKKRLGPDATQSASSSDEELISKRTRPAPATVKILPAKYEECPVEDLVFLIANMIAELIETNDALPPRSNPVLTRFHSR